MSESRLFKIYVGHKLLENLGDFFGEKKKWTKNDVRSLQIHVCYDAKPQLLHEDFRDWKFKYFIPQSTAKAD